MPNDSEYAAGNFDMHLHTIVSDAEITPAEILDCAKELNLEKISITDHDAVGAYVYFADDLFTKAREMGITVVPGIELDSYYGDVEIHVLGYGIDVNNRELNEYLANIHSLRKQRIQEQLEKINQFYKKEVIKKDEIFIPHRDTLMKPHLVHALLKKGLFSEYREAGRWVSENAKSTIVVPKPSTAEMIKLVKSAGGRAFLAHPGYFILEHGLDIDKMIGELQPLGLNGLEAEYPYFQTSPKFQTREIETDMINSLKQTARKYNLKTSRGSDAHHLDQMRAFQKLPTNDTN